MVDSPRDEELDGLRDGEADEGGDEGVVVEDGEVGEGRARRRRGGGGAISTVPHGWTWTEALDGPGRRCLIRAVHHPPCTLHRAGARAPSTIFISQPPRAARDAKISSLSLSLSPRACVARLHKWRRQIEPLVYSNSIAALVVYCSLWTLVGGGSSQSQWWHGTACSPVIFWPCSLI